MVSRDLVPPFVTVIVPVYNEADAIAANLQHISEYLTANFSSHEIIAVDDGSEDATLNAIDQSIKELPQLSRVSYRPNRGKGSAVRAGARKALGEWIAIVDADLELPIEMLPEFFAIQKRTGASIVVGSKRHEASEVVYPWRRMLLSNVYNRLVRLLFDLDLTDTQLGFKLIHSSVLKDIIDPLLVKRYAFDLEILVVESMRGVKVAEAPIRLTFSRAGPGRLNFSAAVSVFQETLGIWYRRFVTGYYARVMPPQSIRDERPIPATTLDS